MALTNAPAVAARVVDTKDRPPDWFVERDQWDRPLIPQPDGTRVGYTRASTLGDLIEDTKALQVYHQRNVAYGIGHTHSLYLAAAGVEGVADGADKRELYRIAKAAQIAAGADEAADRGTALHKLTEVVDRTGTIPAVGEDAVSLAAYQQVMRLFHVLHTEVFIVSDRFQSSGTADRIGILLVELQPVDSVGNPIGAPLPAGTVIVIDLKTSETDRFFGAKFAVQTAVYQDGRIVVGAELAEDGTMTYIYAEHGAHPDWAIIVHMPQGGTVAEVQWVDLARGRRLAELAHDVRDARKLKGLITLAGDLPLEPTHGYDPESGVCVELSDEFTDEDAVAELAAGADRVQAIEAAGFVPPPCCDQFHPAGTTCPDPFLPEDGAAVDPEVASMVRGWLDKMPSRQAAEDDQPHDAQCGPECTPQLDPPVDVDPADLAAVKLGVPVEDVLDDQAVAAITAAARRHGSDCDCFGCEDADGNRAEQPPPVPVAQATLILRRIELNGRRRELVQRIRSVASEAEATALWAAHRDIWLHPEHTEAVAARLAELAAPAAEVAS